MTYLVIPAKAGVPLPSIVAAERKSGIPAFAGMTIGEADIIRASG
jgi:hypothetical protein